MPARLPTRESVGSPQGESAGFIPYFTRELTTIQRGARRARRFGAPQCARGMPAARDRENRKAERLLLDDVMPMFDSNHSPLDDLQAMGDGIELAKYFLASQEFVGFDPSLR